MTQWPQILVALACLYFARALPWLSEKTGASPATIQYGLTSAYLLVLAVMLLLRKEGALFGAIDAGRAGQAVLAGFVLFVVAGVFYGLTAAAYARLGWAQPKELAFLDAKTFYEIGAVAAFVLAAAFLEEYVFRGIILADALARFGAIAAVLISSALFSVYHLSLFQAAPTFVLGLGLGFLYVRSGSLWSPAIAHLTFNLIGAGLFIGGAAAR